MKVVITAVVLAGLLAACSETDEPMSARPTTSATQPEKAELLQGVFSANTAVIDTDLESERLGDNIELELYFVCVDEDCDEVLQRSDAGPETRFGRTVRLESDKRSWNGATVRTVPCPDGSGTGTDHVIWHWSPNGKGRFAGTLEERLSGCGDGLLKSRTNIDARAVGASLPFLAADDAAGFKAAVSAYDTAAEAVAPARRECARTVASGEREPALQCINDLIQRWQPAVAAFDAELDASVADPGPCRDALTDVDVNPLAAELSAVAKQVEELGDAELPDDLLDGVGRQAEALHEGIVHAVVLCVSPDDLEGLGADGDLFLDDEDAIVPPSRAVTTTTTEG